MKTSCVYNSDYEKFLKEVVEYTINRFNHCLDITRLEEIELVNYRERAYCAEGKTIDNGHKIVLLSDKIERLPVYDVSSLLECNNVDFLSIVNTLFHEMGHVTNWKVMPILYSTATNSSDNRLKLPSLFWLEYLAEKRSAVYGCYSNDSLCDSIADRDWRIDCCDFYSANDSNFFYLNKLLPYFLGKTVDKEKRRKYLHRFRNKTVKRYCMDLGAEIKRIEQKMPFDDPGVLAGLYDTMNQYYKIFLL